MSIRTRSSRRSGRRGVRAVLVLAAISVALAGGAARAEHNRCHDEGDVWVVVTGVDVTGTTVGYCLGDFGVFFNLSRVPSGAIGVTTCDFSQQPEPPGGYCEPYAFLGLNGPPFIGTTCVYYSTYEGGSEPEYHHVGLDC